MSRIESEVEILFRSILYETRKIEPSFTVGEKGAITDGHMDIYGSTYNGQTDHSLRNGSYVGRLPVQIKGKLASKNRRLKSFKLKRSELESIDKIGGLVLLVASIDRKSHKTLDPYFADLTGFNARHYLAQMSRTQAEKSVPLKPLPTDPEEVFGYVYHWHRRYRAGFPLSPNDKVMRDLDNIKITLPYDVDWSRPQLFGGPGSSAILETVDNAQETRTVDAILQITPTDYALSPTANLTISCGGVEFDSCRKRRISADSLEFYISPGIRLTFGPTKQNGVRLRFQKSLHDVVKDQKFLVGVLNGDWIMANGDRWLLLDSPVKTLEDFTKPLPYLEDLARLCATFGVDPRLFKVGDLPREEVEAIKQVILCLFYEASFENKQGIPLRQSLKVNGDVIELLWMFDEDAGRWLPISFFDSSKMWFRVPLEHEERIDVEAAYELVTPFEFFSAEELTKVLNLNPEHLVNAYKAVEGDRARQLADATVAKLINAADLCKNRRQEFLSMALDLCHWLKNEDSGSNHLILNEMQIKKRLGTLNTDDAQALTRIWKAAGDKSLGTDSLQIEAAASILLGKSDGADYLLEKMEDQERIAFESRPIYFLKSHTRYETGVPGNQDEWRKIARQIDQEDFDRIAHFRLGKNAEFEHH